MIAVTKYIF